MNWLSWSIFGSIPSRVVSCVLLLVLLGYTSEASAQYGHPPFDFSDQFYKDNGLKPKKLVNRLDPKNGNAVEEDEAPDKDHSNLRILETNGGFDAVGTLLYYPQPPAFFDDDAFRKNRKGREAKEIANKFRAFIFPKADGDPLSPAPPNRRQDNVFDTSSGYLTANPLGLWRITFPRYTDEAFDTDEGQAKLDELEERNGLDLDGTPVIKRLSEILELEELGLLELAQRDEDGSDGPPWVV